MYCDGPFLAIMTNVIIPFTMVPLETAVPRAPNYTTIQIQSVSDHVRSIVPTYLQGTDGVIRLISAFIGTTSKWIRILGDMEEVYRNRNTDLYFLFWVCSHRLPIPDSFEQLRSHWYRRMGTIRRRTHCVDTGSQMLPLGGLGGLCYTRTGHLGTPAELSHLIRTVSCMGYVTSLSPVLSTAVKHVIITRRPHYWTDRVGPAVRVMHVDMIHQLDPGTHWESVVLDLDTIYPSTPSRCGTFPDYRHLSGSISPSWVQIHTTFLLRTMTIVYTQTPPSCTLDILEYMFLLQTTYRGERFVESDFSCERSSFMRLAETMLLSGMIRI